MDHIINSFGIVCRTYFHKKGVMVMWFLLAIVLFVSGLIAANHILIIAAGLFAIAHEIQYLSIQVKDKK